MWNTKKKVLLSAPFSHLPYFFSCSFSPSVAPLATDSWGMLLKLQKKKKRTRTRKACEYLASSVCVCAPSRILLCVPIDMERTKDNHTCDKFRKYFFLYWSRLMQVGRLNRLGRKYSRFKILLKIRCTHLLLPKPRFSLKILFSLDSIEV